jgi:hypothetical protein
MVNTEEDKNTHVSFRIGADTLLELDSFCAENDLTRSQMIRKLIRTLQTSDKFKGAIIKQMTKLAA